MPTLKSGASFLPWNLVQPNCVAAVRGRKVQGDREEADTEAKETEGARREMETDREMQKMRRRQSRSATANICQSLVCDKEGSDVWP